eukprot:gene8142-16733_t
MDLLVKMRKICVSVLLLVAVLTPVYPKESKSKPIVNLDAWTAIRKDHNKFNGTELTKFSRHFQMIRNSPYHLKASIPAILIYPPDHVGVCHSRCTTHSSSSSSNNCQEGSGQGGDHQMAINGAIMQYTAGWDWIQPTPDRNTGIWDDIYLLHTEDVHIYDAYVRTMNISSISTSNSTLN